jgi:hypothetical protein
MTQTALKKEQEALRKVKEDAQKARTALTFVRSQAQVRLMLSWTNLTVET